MTGDSNFEDEDMYDPVSGRKRSSVGRALNKSRLSKYEMDEVFWMEGDGCDIEDDPDE